MFPASWSTLWPNKKTVGQARKPGRVPELGKTKEIIQEERLRPLLFFVKQKTACREISQQAA